jgi:hypothetical protein
MIDDLPELEEGKDMMMPIIRGIRPTVSPHQMQNQQPMMMPLERVPLYEDESSFERPPPQMQPRPQQPQPHVGFVSDVRNKFEDEKRRIYCIEVAEHINSCPICSKFYNVDKTPYILAIVILSIICIILLKRVLSI